MTEREAEINTTSANPRPSLIARFDLADCR
jgi:hypothetical protein